MSRLVSLPVSRVVKRGVAIVALFCDVSFPVIFVYFRFVPELNIFSGIMRFCCGFLLAYRAVFPFSFRHRSTWPRCPCRVLSDDVAGDVICLGVVACLPLGDVPCCPRFVLPGSPLVVPPFRPVSSCRGTGSRRGYLLAS